MAKFIDQDTTNQTGKKNAKLLFTDARIAALLIMREDPNHKDFYENMFDVEATSLVIDKVREVFAGDKALRDGSVGFMTNDHMTDTMVAFHFRRKKTLEELLK